MKLSKAQVKAIESAKKDIDFARAFDSFEEYLVRKTAGTRGKAVLTTFGSTLTISLSYVTKSAGKRKRTASYSAVLARTR